MNEKGVLGKYHSGVMTNSMAMSKVMIGMALEVFGPLSATR